MTLSVLTKPTKWLLTAWMVLATALFWVLAAPDETLRIIVPRAAGTNPGVGPNLPSDYFMLYAHQGVDYRAYAVVVGGVPPYTFELSGAPAGMTIDKTTGCTNTGTGTECFTGKITWTNPQSSSGTITLTVTDSLGTPVQSSWTVTIDNSRFIFADCDDAPGGNTGAIGNPYASLAEVYAAGSAHAGKVLYLRQCAGNYTTVGIGAEELDWNGNSRAEYWLAYPGETVTYDVGHTVGGAVGSYVRFAGVGNSGAFIGIQCRNLMNKCVMKWPGMAYVMMAESNGQDQSGFNGQNPSFFGSDGGNTDPISYFTMALRNDWSDFGSHGQSGYAGDCIKLYKEYYAVVGDNYCHDSVGTSDIIGLDIKGRGFSNVRVVNNLVRAVYRHHCCGSMDGFADGVIEHNRFVSTEAGPGNAVILNEFANATNIHFRRNSIVGIYEVQDISAGNGPLYSSNNVNSSNATLGGCLAGTRIECYGVSDLSRIIISGDLYTTPAAQCLDANGLLTDAGVDDCRTNYLGSKGAEVTGSPPAPPPSAPSNLTVADTSSDDGTQLNLAWVVSTSSGVTEQRVYRSLVSGSSYSLTTTFTNNTTAAYTDTGLSSTNTYYYVVRAYNGTTTLESANSNEASGQPINNQVPPLFQSGGSAGGSAF